MAIDWGGYDGHLRVGIDFVISPANPSPSDTTVDVTWKFYVDSDGWSFDDPETLHESADGWGGADIGFHNGSSGGSILVDTHKVTYGISANSPNKTAHANLTGAYNGATPSNSRTINLPNRPSSTPSAGEQPTAHSITATGVTIQWLVPNDDGGANVDNYEVQIGTGSGFGTIVGDHTMGNTNMSWTFSGLQPNTQYYARVRAHNANGWGDWTSGTWCPFTTLGGAPGTPGTPTASTKGQTNITIGWAAAAQNGGGAVTYTVDRATNSTFTTGLTTVTTTATTYAFIGLVANTTYYFRVKATNSLGASPESGTLTAKTNAPLTYQDSGDYVTLVNNLASAVADKMVHLGIYMWRGKTASTTPAAGTDTPISMGTLIGSRGPDAPTYSGNLTTPADFVIQYPGEYLIEFAFRFDEASGSRFNLNIYVNGQMRPATTYKGGAVMGYAAYGANAAGPMRLMAITRHLDVGDSVAWGIWEGTPAAQPAPLDGNLYAWGKVTMIGF